MGTDSFLVFENAVQGSAEMVGEKIDFLAIPGFNKLFCLHLRVA